jgi:hypothetical protein
MIPAFRRRGINDRPVGVLLLHMDQVACDALHRFACDCAENFFGVFLYARFVLSWRVLGHLAVGREGMKGRQDRQHRNFAPIRLANAMPCWTAFAASSDPSVGINIRCWHTS